MKAEALQSGVQGTKSLLKENLDKIEEVHEKDDEEEQEMQPQAG